MFRNNIDSDRTAIIDENDNKFTYRELNNKAQELLHVIPKRSLVVVLCERDIETVCFYYCMLYNHVVPIMLDGSLADELLMNIVHDYHPEYIWANKKDNIAGNVVYETDNHIIVKTQYISPKLNDNLALLLSTSGSTGSRKLVRIGYQNIIDNAKADVDNFCFNQNDIGITTLPINYCYGLSVLHYHWYVGACVLISDRPMTDEKYWNLVLLYNITSLQIVPYNFTIMRRINIYKLNKLAIRFVVFAGGRMSHNDAVAAYDMFSNMGIDFHIAYGQTESVSAISSLMNEEVLTRIDSVGRTFEDIHANCDSSDGELILQGKSISLGYAYDYNDLQKGDVNQGILRTGDCARIDEDGYIYLTGRKNRFVKILGIRYSLEEIEDILQKHFGINDIVCGGNDNLLKLYVADDVNLEEVQEFCAMKMSINKRMIKVVFLKEIPRNESGKILFSQLTEN